MFRFNLKEDKGQAFVELALMCPIFILLLVGAVEIGYIAYASIEVNNAARAGVAFAAQSPATASDSANILLAATQEAPNVTSLSATTVLACSCESSTGVVTALASCGKNDANLTNCPDTGATPSRIVESVQVNTTAPINTIFKFPGIPSSITLRGYASMRVLD